VLYPHPDAALCRGSVQINVEPRDGGAATIVAVLADLFWTDGRKLSFLTTLHHGAYAHEENLSNGFSTARPYGPVAEQVALL